MNKKILLTFLASLTMVFSVETMNMCGASSVTVPVKRDEQKYILKNDDGTKLVPGSVKCEIHNELLNLTFDTNGDLQPGAAGYSSYALPELEEGWSYFVVLIDSKNKGPIAKQYLNFFHGDGGLVRNSYRCSFNLPYYCEVVDLHVYKQKNTDPEFTIEEKNFIGKTKVYSNHFHDFLRPNAKQQLTFIPRGSSINNKNIYLIPRLTTNYYSILLDITGRSYYIGKIILPNGQGKSLTEDDLIVNSSFFCRYDETGSMISSNSGLDRCTNFSFYLPDDVTNFKFQIFEDKIGKDTDVLYEVDVNLNRT